jgi:hypothetical protein
VDRSGDATTVWLTDEGVMLTLTVAARDLEQLHGTWPIASRLDAATGSGDRRL